MRWKLALSIVALLIFGSVVVWANQEKAKPRPTQDPQAQSRPRQQPPPQQAPPRRAEPRQQPPQRQGPPPGSGQGMGRNPQGQGQGQGMGQGRDPRQARPRQDPGTQRGQGQGMGPGRGQGMMGRDDPQGRGQGMGMGGRMRPPGTYSNELPRGGQGMHPRFPPRDIPRYAVPRTRPTPQPHPQFGHYGRGEYSSGWFGTHRYYFIWRPFQDMWGYRYICVYGHWEWDQWCQCWVWIRGFCNVPGHHHGPDSGFYFWFDFSPRW